MSCQNSDKYFVQEKQSVSSPVACSGQDQLISFTPELVLLGDLSNCCCSWLSCLKYWEYHTSSQC